MGARQGLAPSLCALRRQSDPANSRGLRLVPASRDVAPCRGTKLAGCRRRGEQHTAGTWNSAVLGRAPLPLLNALAANAAVGTGTAA
mmetsp:Transcript_41889/g.95462  ORF Transcript_41889/g.95462 Transcript_41889/m.95462 type:complete len:87 (-) Transcript_41889:89-349(-)